MLYILEGAIEQEGTARKSKDPSGCWSETRNSSRANLIVPDGKDETNPKGIPKKKNPFEPTDDEKRRWDSLPEVQEKCKELWMDVMITDSILEKLCLSPVGEYEFDPIAMTAACMADPNKFAKAEDKVWKAACMTARAQLKFLRRIQRCSKKHNLNMLAIRRTCDLLAIIPT